VESLIRLEKEEKTIQRGDFGSKLTLNHPSLIDKKKKRMTVRVWEKELHENFFRPCLFRHSDPPKCRLTTCNFCTFTFIYWNVSWVQKNLDTCTFNCMNWKTNRITLQVEFGGEKLNSIVSRTTQILNTTVYRIVNSMTILVTLGCI